MKTMLCCLALAVAATCLAATDDSLWISHYNGVDGWFEFQGPERAMRLDPSEFGLDYPVRIESLKIWFYWGMGSFTDSVFTFKVYGDDGQTLLFESESLTCPRSYWAYYGLTEPVTVDSGCFWIAATARRVDPYAHPYINVDDGTPADCYYGNPGAWNLCTVGNYCFFAFVREIQTGVGDATWAGPRPAGPLPTVCGSVLRLPAGPAACLFDLNGRAVARLLPGTNQLAGVNPGVYLVRFDGCRARSRIIVVP